MDLKVLFNIGNGHECQNVYCPTGIAPTVRENHGKITKILLVYGQTKLTSMQHKSTGETMEHEIVNLPHKIRFRKKDKKMSGMQGKDIMKPHAVCDILDNHPKWVMTKGANSMKETSPKLKQKKSQTTTCLSEDFHVRLSALLEKEGDLKIPEVHSFLKSQGLHRKNDHALYSLKMSKAYYLTTKGELSELSSPRWMKLGMTANGKCLTLKTSVSPRIGKECSLSDKEKIIDKYLSFL